MKFGVAAPYGVGLSWAIRLKDEGHDVRMWISDPQCKTVGDGLVEKCGTFDDLAAHVRDGGIMLFELSKLGEKADALRRAGIPTLCGGGFMDRLEKDRTFGVEIAREAGCTIPAYEDFSSIGDALERVRELDAALFFKTDRLIDSDATHGADTAEEMVEYLEGLIEKHGAHGACILQEKISGVALSTARWWNGMDWVGPYQADYENKKFMNDDVGPSTGCSFNAVWFYDDEPEVARRLCWENFTPLFRKHQAPPGIYDVNAMIAPDGTAYFLEWTPRLGYDSEMLSALLLPDLGRHIAAVATGHDPLAPSDELGYSIKLSVPPYPWEHGHKDHKGSSHGVLLRGNDGLWDGGFVPYMMRRSERFPDALEVVGPDGEIGLAAAVGDSLPDLHEDAMETIKRLRVAGLQYRTDGADDIKKKVEELVEAGYDVHPGLLE